MIESAVLLGAIIMTAAALSVMAEGSISPEEEDSKVEDLGWTYEDPTGACVVAMAIIDVIVASAPEKSRANLSEVLIDRLLKVADDGKGAILAVPVPPSSAMDWRRIRDLAMQIGESYRTPIKVERHSVRGIPFAIVMIGKNTESSRAPLEWLEEFGAGRGGGLMKLVVDTVVSSAVGTVTSMATQSLVHSMGGEPRLARIMRRYNRAEASGDKERANKIKAKVLRSAARIQGREVDWNQIKELAGTP